MRITRRRLLELTGTTLPAVALVAWTRSVGSVVLRTGPRAKPGVPLLAQGAVLGVLHVGTVRDIGRLTHLSAGLRWGA